MEENTHGLQEPTEPETAPEVEITPVDVDLMLRLRDALRQMP